MGFNSSLSTIIMIHLLLIFAGFAIGVIVSVVTYCLFSTSQRSDDNSDLYSPNVDQITNEKPMNQ
jgi:archaellum component FlaG (FlaF/FlaG flagellin family)